MTVGERIKFLREKLNISQVDFADKINVSKQTLYKYENNIITNIPSDKIEAIADISNVSPAYIMGWDTAELPSNIEKMTTTVEKWDILNNDKRLQEIIHCYNNMTDEGKNLLLGQAQFYYQQFSNPVSNARAM